MDFLSSVERQLDLPRAEKAQVIRELKCHYEELKEELMASGLDADAAERETERRLGEPADVAARLSAVHNTASWRSAILTALPFLIPLPLVILSYVFKVSTTSVAPYTLPLGLLITIGTIREFARGRRPVWLATWFAYSITTVLHLSTLVYHHVSPPKGTVAGDIVLVLVLWAVIGLTVGWRSSYRVVMSILSISCIGIALASKTIEWPWHPEQGAHVVFIGLLAYLLVMFVMPLMTSLAVFAKNVYGSAAQASLFLFTAIYLPILESFDKEIVVMLLSAGSILIYAGTVICLTRASTLKLKLGTLAGGFLLISMLRVSALVHNNAPDTGIRYAVQHAILTAAVYFGVFGLVIFLPMLMESLKVRRQAEIVR